MEYKIVIPHRVFPIAKPYAKLIVATQTINHAHSTKVANEQQDYSIHLLYMTDIFIVIITLLLHYNKYVKMGRYF